MSKFKFRFESVRKVKEAFEIKAQKELAQIEMYITKHQELREKLTEEINDLRNSAYKKKMNAAELQFLGGYDTVLRQQIELQSEVITQFEKKREKKIEEVVVKSKEKKILDQLEGAHREKFYKDINVTELKNFDEIGVQNFNKVKK